MGMSESRERREDGICETDGRKEAGEEGIDKLQQTQQIQGRNMSKVCNGCVNGLLSKCL